MNVTSQQGDTVDMLCQRHLNTTAVVEQVLEANPQIAFLPATLPIGTTIELPETVTATTKQLVQLWD